MNLHKFKLRLFEPVDIAPLVTFRIAFGILLLWDVWRYFYFDWIDRFYVEPQLLFKYYGFSWVESFSSFGMHAVFAVLGLCCVLIIFGLFYRAAIIVFTFLFCYVFLLDQARYLNHFYLVIIFSVLLCFLPASRDFSLDAKFFKNYRIKKIPRWMLWMVVLQLEIVLIYAGLVKINPDWLQLEPLRMWLDKRRAMPLVGQLFQQDWAVAVASYGVIALHLIGAPLLLWKKTRLIVFAIYCSFHVLNHFVFTIGIFPWLTIAATTLLFSPQSHRNFWQNVLRKRELSFSKDTSLFVPTKLKVLALSSSFFVWFFIQIFFPLRHHLYPDDVAWNEEGHRFSWRMKLRDKKSKAQFSIEDPDTNRIIKINRRDFLTSKQSRLVPCHPDILLQFAHYLDEHFRKQGISDPIVRLNGKCSLNGRDWAPFVDPKLDLSQLDRNLKHNDWILPLTLSLDERRPSYQRVIDRRQRNQAQ